MCNINKLLEMYEMNPQYMKCKIYYTGVDCHSGTLLNVNKSWYQVHISSTHRAYLQHKRRFLAA